MVYLLVGSCFNFQLSFIFLKELLILCGVYTRIVPLIR